MTTTLKPAEFPGPDSKKDEAQSEMQSQTRNRTDEFAKSATAAKISGAFNETAGFMKRKIGELTKDAEFEKSGHNQELLGKIHRLVGTVRGIRDAATTELMNRKIESQAICRKHAGRLLDGVSDFIEDVKKTLFK